MIKEYILNKLLDKGIKETKPLLKEHKYNLLSNNEMIEESLSIHLKKLKRWSREVSFKDARETKSISDIYIDLDMSLVPKRNRLESEKEFKTINIYDLPKHEHLILLGDPGAGKTTSIKYLTRNILFTEGFYENINYPLMLEFKETSHFNSPDYIFNELIDLFGINFKKPDNIKENKSIKNVYSSIVRKYILKFLETQSLALILDGFDELPSRKAKKYAINNIRLIASTLEKSKIIITSRSSDFQYHIEHAKEFEFLPLTPDQINSFTIKWLGDKKEGEELFNEIMKSPYADTSMRPLTIAHLCAIYKRTGELYKKPKQVYRKVVRLLLEEWDEQRSVPRLSNYANFSIDLMFEFLCKLAYILTTEHGTTRFSSLRIKIAYQKICKEFGLPKEEYKKVFRELETHSGLIIKSGYDTYQFAHKSIQEYLTAEHLRSLPSIPKEINLLSEIPNELAIAVSISSGNEYLIELYNDRLKSRVSSKFYNVFLNRLVIEKPELSSNLKVLKTLLEMYAFLLQGEDLTEDFQIYTRPTSFLENNIFRGNSIEKFIIFLLDDKISLVDIFVTHYNKIEGDFTNNRVYYYSDPETENEYDIVLPKRIVELLG